MNDLVNKIEGIVITSKVNALISAITGNDTVTIGSIINEVLAWDDGSILDFCRQVKNEAGVNTNLVSILLPLLSRITNSVEIELFQKTDTR